MIDRTKLSGLVDAIQDQAPVSGLTHDFYRYPARFSPLFVRAAIQAFTRPGHVILDPFMGGGTTLVEAKVHRVGPEWSAERTLPGSCSVPSAAGRNNGESVNSRRHVRYGALRPVVAWGTVRRGAHVSPAWPLPPNQALVNPRSA